MDSLSARPMRIETAQPVRRYSRRNGRRRSGRVAAGGEDSADARHLIEGELCSPKGAPLCLGDHGNPLGHTKGDRRSDLLFGRAVVGPGRGGAT